MNYRTPTILAVLCSLCMVAGIIGAGSAMADTGIGQAYGPVHGQGTCAEDEPCWNWRTMGNRTRGIVTKGGRYLVVNGARFDRIRHAGRIDWTRIGHMRGDRKTVVRFDSSEVRYV